MFQGEYYFLMDVIIILTLVRLSILLLVYQLPKANTIKSNVTAYYVYINNK